MQPWSFYRRRLSTITQCSDSGSWRKNICICGKSQSTNTFSPIFAVFHRFFEFPRKYARVSQEICQGSGVLSEDHAILTKTRGKYPRFPKLACFHPILPNFACFQASCPPLPKFPHVAQGQRHIMLKLLPCALTV